MARRKLSDKHIRKLARIGNKSIGLTLPIEIVRELKWREKQKVVVKKRGKGILITDWKQIIYPDHVLGKILLDVEQNGEAYYIYPKDKKAYYLGRLADAFQGYAGIIARHYPPGSG